MLRVHRLADDEAQLQSAQALIGFPQFGGLLPRRRHQRFLLLLDHLRSERGDRAITRLEIELVEP